MGWFGFWRKKKVEVKKEPEVKMEEPATNKFSVFYNNVETKHPTFRDAFIHLYNSVRSSPRVSIQLLETWTWIKEEGEELPIMFWPAVNKARALGILTDDGRIS